MKVNQKILFVAYSAFRVIFAIIFYPFVDDIYSFTAYFIANYLLDVLDARILAPSENLRKLGRQTVHLYKEWDWPADYVVFFLTLLKFCDLFNISKIWLIAVFADLALVDLLSYFISKEFVAFKYPAHACLLATLVYIYYLVDPRLIIAILAPTNGIFERYHHNVRVRTSFLIMGAVVNALISIILFL